MRRNVDFSMLLRNLNSKNSVFEKNKKTYTNLLTFENMMIYCD